MQLLASGPTQRAHTLRVVLELAALAALAARERCGRGLRTVRVGTGPGLTTAHVLCGPAVLVAGLLVVLRLAG